jgi:rhomboid family GlyGly-CTERM serine protease
MIEWQSLISALDYSRQEVLSGEWWRLLSWHFVHLDITHAASNLVMLLVMALWIPKRVTIAALLLISGLLGVLSASLIFLIWPQVHWYLGLSGLLHGLWFWIGVSRKDVAGVTILALLLLKLLIDPLPSSNTGLAIPIPVLREGHWAGVLSSLILLLFSQLRRRLLTGLEHPLGNR